MRINVSTVLGDNQNRDVALNMDIHDASRGLQDSWIFYGDYTSAGGITTAHEASGPSGSSSTACAHNISRRRRAAASALRRAETARG